MFEEINTLADSAPPYHLRSGEITEAQLEGYTMVDCLEKVSLFVMYSHFLCTLKYKTSF